MSHITLAVSSHPKPLTSHPCISLWNNMLRLARNTHYFGLKWISFSWLCVSYCHFTTDTGIYPRLLCEERKKTISSSIVEEPAQLNLIIMWRRKSFQWRHLPVSLDFITDVISACCNSAALSSSFKILIWVCCSNILSVQNTCCKPPWPSDFPVS